MRRPGRHGGTMPHYREYRALARIAVRRLMGYPRLTVAEAVTVRILAAAIAFTAFGLVLLFAGR